jgi:hypothetical protein
VRYRPLPEEPVPRLAPYVAFRGLLQRLKYLRNRAITGVDCFWGPVPLEVFSPKLSCTFDSSPALTLGSLPDAKSVVQDCPVIGLLTLMVLIKGDGFWRSVPAGVLPDLISASIVPGATFAV